MRNVLLPLGVVLSFASDSQAHISLKSPPARSSAQKQGPCGAGASDPRSASPTKFSPGETITVSWKETIGHPGHFRIAFDPNGDGLFQDPSSFTDVSPRPGVLKDNIADKTGTQTYTEQVTLPDVECTKCTLQVVQIMTDKAPYGDGDDLYYQCADLILARASSSADAGTLPDAGAIGGNGDAGAALASDAGTVTSSRDEGDDTGCSALPQRTSWLSAGGLALALVAIRVMRRRALMAKA